MPPSILITWPVIYDDRSEAKNNARLAISSGSPTLFSDKFEVTSFITSTGVFSFIMSVLVKPGAIVFTLIFKGPNSLDKVFDCEIKAALDAE